MWRMSVLSECCYLIGLLDEAVTIVLEHLRGHKIPLVICPVHIAGCTAPDLALRGSGKVIQSCSQKRRGGIEGILLQPGAVMTVLQLLLSINPYAPNKGMNAKLGNKRGYLPVI